MIHSSLAILIRSVGLCAMFALGALIFLEIQPVEFLSWAEALVHKQPWYVPTGVFVGAQAILAYRPHFLPSILLGLILLYAVGILGDLGGVWREMDRPISLGVLAIWLAFVASRWGFPFYLSALLAAIAGLFLFDSLETGIERQIIQLTPTFLAPWLARRVIYAPLPSLR